MSDTINTKQQFITPQVQEDKLELLSKKLLEANEMLKKSETQRSIMLANISHDLRAPITAIRNAVDLIMADSEMPIAELRSTIEIIDRRTRVLEDLIQDMYYLFCVEDKSRTLKKEIVSAVQFLEEFFFDATTNTIYDNHNMQIDVPVDLSVNICIDIPKMIRVLENLFVNAAKYSGDGTDIILRAECSEDKKYLNIYIEDNGIGIPGDAIEHIFDRTYTVSRARTPGKTSGSGLGLAIVSAIIEKHSGTISCHSTLGQGCSFKITLPVL